MSHHDHNHLPPPPERMRFSAAVLGVAVVALLAGFGAFGASLALGHAELAWSSYLIGAFYALGLGVFGVLWVAILYLSRGTWSVTMRRIPEAMSAWVLPGGILALLVGLAGHGLYIWADAQVVAKDAALSAKAAFLNPKSFYLLVGGAVLLWFMFSQLIVGNSVKQDATGEARFTRRNVMLSAMFAVVFALSFSVVSFYLIMSLEPHWSSTMFAVVTFTDMMQTGLAFVSLMAAILIKRGGLRGFLNENHLHSVSKMMFAFTGFWAYIYFCQFMLIWYGNLPEEITYFSRRAENGWLVYLLALPLIKFVIPFIYLVPRENKRQPNRVIMAASLLMVAQFLELFMMIAPTVGAHGGVTPAHAPLIEGLVTLGFLGAFVLLFAWTLGRRAPVPLKDPMIRECLHYHQ